MFKDFKDFVMRGNVMDMAIGIVLGVAFGKIVASFVNDVLMPPIGWAIGNVDFSSLAYTLQQKTADHAAVVIKYGVFINTIIDFIIIAFAIFMVVRQINKLSKKKAPDTKDCSYCQKNVALEASRCPFCTSELSQSTS